MSPVRKAAALLCRLNWRRQINQLGSMFRLRKPASGRAATARKSAAGRLLTALVAASMLYRSFNLAHQGLTNLTKALGSVETSEGTGAGLARGRVEAGDRSDGDAAWYPGHTAR